MKLTDRFDDVIVYRDQPIKLNLAFDIVLRSMELWNDNRFDEAEKIDIFVKMFAEHQEDVTGLDVEEKAYLVNVILEKFILDEQDIAGKSTGTPQQKTHDLEQDAEYIYASFLFDYNIDLFEQHGKLHWKKFKALLNNLSEESKFMKVIGYRTADIPPENKHNRKEVQRLRKLKQLYKLETNETVADLDAKFDNLASMLRLGG